jgi:hypothetical protein
MTREKLTPHHIRPSTTVLRILTQATTENVLLSETGFSSRFGIFTIMKIQVEIFWVVMPTFKYFSFVKNETFFKRQVLTDV